MADVNSSVIGLSNLLLVTPQTQVGFQPQTGPVLSGSTVSSIPTIIFNYEGEQYVEVQSDITDHFVETNIAIQDQISLKPVEVSTHGFVGDLNNVPPAVLTPYILAAQAVLANISAYEPELTITAINAYNQAFQEYQIAQSAVNAVHGSGIVGQNQSPQQLYFSKFFGWWQNRTLFTIQTPWNILQNMAIKSMRPYQDESTRTVTDFQLTFKQIQFAQSQPNINFLLLGANASSTTYDSNNFTGRAQTAGAVPVNLGTNQLSTSPTTLNSVVS